MAASKKKQIRQYNTTISKLFNQILNLSEEQQEMLLKHAEFLPKKEKRVHDRKKCHVKIFFANSKQLYQSYIENISSTGLFIKADEPFLAGKELLMLFNLAGIKKTVRIWGEIVHTTSEGIGVKFRKPFPPAANE